MHPRAHRQVVAAVVVEPAQLRHAPLAHHGAEGTMVVDAYTRCGNKWACIARLLLGRTDNSMNNHRNSNHCRFQCHARAMAAGAARASASSASTAVRTNVVAVKKHVVAVDMDDKRRCTTEGAAANVTSDDDHRWDNLIN